MRGQVLQPVEFPSFCVSRAKMVFEMGWACYWEDAAWGLQMRTCWRTKCVSAVSPVAEIGGAFVIVFLMCLCCVFVTVCYCAILYLGDPKAFRSVRIMHWSVACPFLKELFLQGLTILYCLKFELQTDWIIAFTLCFEYGNTVQSNIKKALHTKH